MFQVLLNSIIAGSVYALVAMSFNLIYGASRTFNFAHGVFGAVAAYSVFFLSEQNGLPVAASIPIALVAAGVLALLLELLIFRPLRGRRASNFVLLIASLGASVALEALLATVFTNQFKTMAELVYAGSFRVFDGVVTGVQAAAIVSSVLVLGVLWLLLSKTRFGRAVRAVSDDEEVAKMIGIDTNRIVSVVFLIGGALMGAAGVFAGFDTGLEPHMGFLLILDGAIAAIVGGIGNVYGAFLGAYLVGFAENFGVWYVSGEWKYAIAFAILILFLIVRPQGFFGKRA